jgi:hypothetical protein
MAATLYEFLAAERRKGNFPVSFAEAYIYRSMIFNASKNALPEIFWNLFFRNANFDFLLRALNDIAFF